MHCGESRKRKSKEQGEVKVGLDAARWDRLSYIDYVDVKDDDAKVRMSVSVSVGKKDRQTIWRP